MTTSSELDINAPDAAVKTDARVAERLIPILLFAGTFLYLLAFRRVANMDPDEGIVLQGAERILHGEIPYRDFFTFYTPASFFLTALTLKIFGNSLPVARMILVTMGSVFPIITYLLARRTCSRDISLLVSVLVALCSAPYRFMVLHNWDSSFWACLAAYYALRWMESQRALHAGATGVFAALTFLSEQSKGVGLCLGLMLATLILSWGGRKMRHFRILILGFLLPIAPLAAYFTAQHALGSMYQDLIWPLLHYSAANHVRYGDQNWSDNARMVLFHSGPAAIRVLKAIAVSPGFIVPILPIIAVILLCYWALRLRRNAEAKATYYVLLCSLFAGLLVSVVVVRADIIHFMYLAPLFFVVLVWLLDAKDIPGTLVWQMRRQLLAFTIVAFGLMSAALFFSAMAARHRNETRRGVIFTREADSVLRYALARTVPGETILVYPYLPLYYYLTATWSPSKYEYFQPGMSTPEQAQETISSIESAKVQTVFFEPAFVDKIPHSWPGTPLAAIAYDPIADYLTHNYKVCESLQSAAAWNFVVMRRKGLPCQ